MFLLLIKILIELLAITLSPAIAGIYKSSQSIQKCIEMYVYKNVPRN